MCEHWVCQKSIKPHSRALGLAVNRHPILNNFSMHGNQIDFSHVQLVRATGLHDSACTRLKKRRPEKKNFKKVIMVTKASAHLQSHALLPCCSMLAAAMADCEKGDSNHYWALRLFTRLSRRMTHNQISIHGASQQAKT